MKNLILTIVFAAVCSVSAFADEYFSYDANDDGRDVYYKLHNGEVSVISPREFSQNVEGASYLYSQHYYGDVFIPDYFEDDEGSYPVTEIANGAFDEIEFQGSSDRLTGIVLPGTIRRFGANSFRLCESMDLVAFYGSIAEWCMIDNGGHFSNPLEYAHNLKIWDNSDHAYHLVTDLVIPEGVTKINGYVFYGATCLTSVTIPSSVTEIEYEAFQGCSGLTTITFNATNCTLDSYDSDIFGGCSSVRTLNIGSDVSRIPNNTFKYIRNLDKITVAAQIPPEITSSTFDSNLSLNTPVIVPCGTVEIYEDADFWYSFRHIQQSADCGSTGIDNDYANEIALFPNPATDILNITSSETISEIEIVNVMGQVVRHIEVNSDNAVCDVENLPNGFYVVRIYNEDTKSFCQKKFAKE